MCNARPPLVRDNKGEHKNKSQGSKMKISFLDGKRLDLFREIQTSVRKKECRLGKRNEFRNEDITALIITNTACNNLKELRELKFENCLLKWGSK